MGKSLYRTYRPKSFEEIIGQDHITAVIRNSLANNAISHAYLLSGPRGVGKTSVARIIAFEVNGQSYDEDTANLDIIEIDAASNRRIDEIREIRERIHIAPTVGKYKIYIIDEVHMLTREAFNALLKTLEEPPAHVIFILATTESHKVPETIISRCITLSFRPIPNEILAKHLMYIAKQEKIKISPNAINLLSEHARGSFRDGISLLEQVGQTSNSIDVDDVNAMLGLSSEARLNEIVSAVLEGNLQATKLGLEHAYEGGASEAIIASQLGSKFRNLMLSGANGFDPKLLIDVQFELLKVPGSPKPRTALELCLLNLALAKTPPEKPEKVTSVQPVEIKKASISQLAVVHKKGNDENQKETNDRNVKSKQINLWPKLLQALKNKNNTLYGVARMADVEESENAINLSFNFAFHHKQLSESKNKAILSKLLEEINGQPVKLTSEYNKTSKVMPSENLIANNDSFQNVSNIFGAHEVLES